jgi:ABC-type transport system substrate-binding protein
MGMNNNKINQTFRQVISHAIDYAYITDEIMEGTADRLESPIPEGILMGGWSHQEATYNLTKARMMMQAIGYGFNGTDTTLGWKDPGAVTFTPFDLDYHDVWEYAATHGREALSVSFTYNIGNQMREDMLALLQRDMPRIGITVIGYGMQWSEYIYRLYEVGTLNRDMLELYWIGWGPDYNDPSNFINPLFTNRSVASNGAQYNGYLAAMEAGRDPLLLNDNVQLLMEEGLVETNPVARAAIYTRIQELLVEEDMPWVYGYSSKVFDAYVVALTGFQTNTMGKVWFYPCSYA